MKLRNIVLGALLAIGSVLNAQQPQTQNAPLYAVNAKYTNGVAPGYYPTQQAIGTLPAAMGLTINIGQGTVYCSLGSVVNYSGGTLTLTPSSTNYIYLDGAASCAPAFSTSTFAANQVPIATVTTDGSTIISVSDDRTPFSNVVSTTPTTGCPTTGCTFTGPVILASDVLTSSNGKQAATFNAAVTVYSVEAFGAQGDRLDRTSSGTFFTGSMTASGTTLTTAGTAFTSNDVGKYVAFTAPSAQPFATVAWTTSDAITYTPSNVAQIVSVTDATHVELSKSAANSFSAFMAYGTDNTPYFANCAQAVMSKPAAGGNCQVPQGIYMFATAPYWTLPGAYDNGDYGFSTTGGSGMTLNCSISGSGGQISGCTIANPGSGYTDNSDIPVRFSGGCPVAGLPNFSICASQEAFALAHTNGTGQGVSVNVVVPGFGFTSPPTAVVGQLGGDGAAATVTIGGGTITSNTVTAGGSGYPASSSMGVIAIGGGCTLLGVPLGTAPEVAVGNISTTAGGAATGTITWTTPASGCTSAPTIIFGGGAACNTGTASSPTYVQCTNLSAITPTPWPTSIWVPQGVSFVGSATKTNQGAQLTGVWDGATVDNNQATLMGGTLAHSDILNLTFGRALIGLVGDNNTNYGTVDNLLFNTGIGMLTQSTDLNFSCSNLQFQGNVSWVSGGAWRHRLNYPLGAGGIFDGYGCSNMIVRLAGHSALSDSIDTWFANNVWRPEFSGASPDMPGGNGCTFPQTLNQRQTSRVAVQNINNLCYEGIAGAGMTILTRDGRGTGGTTFTNITVKSGFRANFYGSLGGGTINGVGCEGCTHLTTDPYRAGAALEGAVITDETGTGSVNGVNYFGTGVSYCLYSIANAGIPQANRWNGLVCQGGVTNAEVDQDPKYKNILPFNYGLSIATQTNNPDGSGITFGGYRGGGVWGVAGKIIGTFTNLEFLGSDGSTDLLDMSLGGNNFHLATTFATNIKLLSGGVAMTGNQGTGVLLQHSTGPTVSGNFTKFDAFGNTVDSGIAATSPITNIQISTNTTLIAANTCSSSTATTMTGLATTSAIIPPTPTSDTASITGWGASGGLEFTYYPTANTLNWRVCNVTSSPITPGGSVTWNVGAR